MPVNKLPLNGLGRLGLIQASALLAGAGAINVQDDAQAVEDFKEAIEEEERRRLPQVYVLREQYEKMDEEQIKKVEYDNHCVLVPVEQGEIDRLRQDSIPFTMPPMTKAPDIRLLTPYYGRSGKPGGNKTPKIAPKNYASKKRAKRKQEKKSRKNNHRRK